MDSNCRQNKCNPTGMCHDGHDNRMNSARHGMPRMNQMPYMADKMSQKQCGGMDPLTQSQDRGCMDAVEQFPVGMAYVPWQQWSDTYELCRAIQAGTIFPELDKPFLGMKGGRGSCS